MAESKPLVVLANSVRNKPNACVAGREIADGKNSGRKYGGWIRPVSKTGNGELSFAQRSLTSGKEVSVLDIVEVQLAKQQNDPLQPENWIVDGEKNWKLLGRAKAKDLDELVESPPGIWMEKGEPQDRVSTEYIKQKAKKSLLLIKVPDVTIVAWQDSFQGKPWKRRRIQFRYEGLNYDLAFTDPAIESRFGVKYPTTEQFVKKVDGPCYLCISLAHETKNDRHFKLIAGLIDPKMLK